ncbi:hypothetical protein KYC5002_48875 [Archangium violaceum]|uniref:hypothetical protein n=1 Tax=Archangium violaceum TaxID=83451 RepID=UPI002B30C431|nr:hypothetical protein KYC5002_48875 [Archangium gephyra]
MSETLTLGQQVVDFKTLDPSKLDALRDQLRKVISTGDTAETFDKVNGPVGVHSSHNDEDGWI